MEREVIPIVGDGNCLFRAVSYCLFNNQEHHREIRLMVVEKVKNEWEYYRHFIIGDLSYRLPVNSALEYESLLSLDGEYAGHVELYCIGQLFPNYLFRVYRDDNNESQDYGTGNIICNLLFSGNLDRGHYSVLTFRPRNFPRNENSSFVKDSNCNILQQTTNNRRKRKKTLTGRREKLTKQTQNKQNNEKQKCRRALLKNISNDVTPLNLGNLDKKCDYCSALYYSCETNSAGYFGLCCSNKKIKLSDFKCPDAIKQLFTNNNVLSQNFRQNIRQYNNCLSFVSVGANIKVPPGYGPYCFRILGTVYHTISDLYPKSVGSASYGQLHILDFSEANQIRLQNSANISLRKDVLEILNKILNQNNPYVRSYKTMHQKICEEKELALKENRIPLNFVMRFYHEPQSDQRRYNHPTCSEVAAVFESVDGAPPSHRHIAVYPNEGGLKKIDYDSMHCDPMSYVLIWPCGEPGWHISMQTGGERTTKVRQNISMREYISYRLMVRGDFNPVINAGKLSQQLIVDYYCRIEGDRLKFIRNQQTKLRVDTYIGLADALHVRAENENLKAGRIVILPSSFTGSPRNMMQNYQDAMAMVRKFGKPDIFLTFTCNPQWPEIKNNIHPYEAANNRCDIIVRVFHLKVKELLRLINQKEIFGEVQTFLYTIEFQKRGLPHVHLLLCLKDNYKFREISDIDECISAEIPDPNNVILYNLVKSHMVHGPCGILNPKSVCMVEGKCTKEFPKMFIEETKENVNGYPLYRRRNNGRTITKNIHGKDLEVDNRYIVPYNPFLLMYFQAHINVELCASVHSVKYIHKYVYKGHDCANIEITAENEGTLHHDEVSTFLNTRYVSPSEAAYRIFSFPMHEQSHTIIRLPVHLPHKQQVYFHEDNATEALLRAEMQRTELTAWFDLNKNLSTRSSYIYPETPVYYVWNKQEHIWKKRVKKLKIIGRMYNVSPVQSEQYHLRLLLLYVVGATSFEDLRTYNNVLCASFKEAAMRRGLLQDDTEWHRCLQEASVFQMPFQMRQLFAYICIFQQPSNAVSLWDTFKDSLSEDYLLLHSQDIAYKLTLSDINEALKLHGLSLSIFNLPNENNLPSVPHNEPQLTLNYDVMFLQANHEQRVIIDEISKVIQENNTNRSNAYFIDGPGGTGKTFLYQCLISKCHKEDYEVISVAWTGIAAMLLPNGRTVHSRFKLPLRLHESSVSSLDINSKMAADIKSARLIIWDEAPMASAHALLCVNRLLQDIMGNKIAFGGKIILLGGDFRQVLPVVPHSSRQTIVQNCIKFSPLWSEFKIFKLYKNMRAGPEQQDFTDFLIKIGNGEYPAVNNEHFENSVLIELPANIISQQDIVTEIFGAGFLKVEDVMQVSKYAILAPKNEHCNHINTKVLNLIPGMTKTYVSVNNLVTEEPNEVLQFPVEFLNSLELSGLPPHILTLKVGAIVMLLRNLNVSQGLLNGTRLIIKHLYENCLDMEIITGVRVGQRVLIPRIDLIPSDASLPFSFKRRQFPIRLAFCMTINKAQGQTLERVGIYLPQPVFTHGQLYVAMSRARSFDSLKVQIVPYCHMTSNVVYKEVL